MYIYIYKYYILYFPYNQAYTYGKWYEFPLDSPPKIEKFHHWTVGTPPEKLTNDNGKNKYKVGPGSSYK